MKKLIPDTVNCPGSPGDTSGNVVAPWPCTGIHGRSAVIVTSAGVPTSASVTDTTHVPRPTSGTATGGVLSVCAETSVPTYAPEVDVTISPGMYATAGVSKQPAKSASCGPAASGL